MTSRSERLGALTGLATAVLVAVVLMAMTPGVAHASVKSVGAGGFHTCAVKTSGSVVCWGNNDAGQVSKAPTASDFAAVSAGYYFNCALKTDRSIACWGNDGFEQVSKAPTASDFAAVSAGYYHACALKTGGSVVCWGNDSQGQVSKAPSTSDFAAVSAGGLHTCALKTDGSITCWGQDGAGQVSKTPTTKDFAAVSAGGDHVCALKTDGSVVCWGNDSQGQVSKMPSTSDFVAVSAGGDHTCAVKTSGSVVCWGRDTYGQVSKTPTSSSFAAVSAGYNHSCALKTDGSVQCWGDDSDRRLGVAPATPSPAPSDGQLGTAYSHAFTSSTGNPSGGFSVSGGSLSPGLSLSPSGVLSGTPTQSGRYTFTVTASDGVFAGAGQQFTISINDVTAPTTNIALDPASASGQNGWYTGSVRASVTAADGAGGSGVAETRCVLDPVSAPSTFAELPAGPCPYLGGASVSSDGQHTLYAASEDNAANRETPLISRSFEIDATAPTTAIGLTPGGADGQNGWYVSGVGVAVAAQDGTGGSGAAETRCALDPATPPTSFADLSPGCDYAGAGASVSSDGQHTLYAASTDSAGNVETPLAVRSFKIDRTAPTASCDAAKTFVLGGTGGNVSAIVTDTTSGPAKITLSAPADVSSPGNRSVSLTGYDNAGNPTTVSCPYTVGYGFSDFLSPIPQSSYKAGSTIPVKFRLLDGSGSRISNAAAGTLASSCRVKVYFGGGTPANNCAGYNARNGAFQYDLKTPSGLASGFYTITVRVFAPNGSGIINEEKVQVFIRR